MSGSRPGDAHQQHGVPKNDPNQQTFAPNTQIKNGVVTKVVPWTPAEEDLLIRLKETQGLNRDAIFPRFPKRTPPAIKAKYQLMLSKRAKQHSSLQLGATSSDTLEPDLEDEWQDNSEQQAYDDDEPVSTTSAMLGGLTVMGSAMPCNHGGWNDQEFAFPALHNTQSFFGQFQSGDMLGNMNTTIDANAGIEYGLYPHDASSTHLPSDGAGSGFIGLPNEAGNSSLVSQDPHHAYESAPSTIPPPLAPQRKLNLQHIPRDREEFRRLVNTDCDRVFDLLKSAAQPTTGNTGIRNGSFTRIDCAGKTGCSTSPFRTK